jgi:hypothetical protein
MLTGGVFVLVGLLIIAFSVKIVFPGLARWLGNDLMFGKGNVYPDGSYRFSNPRPLIEWVALVGTFGTVLCAAWIWVSGIRIKFPSKKSGLSELAQVP